MRYDNESFSSFNQSQDREPRLVFELDFGSGDIYYLTSHRIAGLAGENVIDGVLVAASGTSQKLNPDKANSEIGAISFEVLDDGLTALQKAKLADGKGLRGKTVHFYVGWSELDWGSFILAQTQIVEMCSYKSASYKFKCADIQRELREDIFQPKETRLSATLEAKATEIEVYTTSGFELVQQPNSPGGRTLAPGEKIGLLVVESDDQKEVILYTGIEPFKFTGCRRGVLGTKPLKIETSEDSDRDSAPKITEFVYLEMPAPMLAYAILTGSIYGYPGAYLPDHWHLGVSSEFIRTSEFTGIGEDLWDLDDFDAGLPARLAGVEKEDGKKFVEEQLLRMMGCYMPVYSDGQLGLRRMTGVLSTGGYVRELNADNVVDFSDLTHDMNAVVNRLVVYWNYDFLRDELTRTYILNDGESQSMHGEADPLEVELHALSASRVSSPTIKNLTDALRDRYAGPPLRIELTLTPDQNDLDVGDIVRVVLDDVQDYTGETENGRLRRNFEVQQCSTDWRTGQVKVKLFGSSQPASALPPEEYGSALPNEWYGSEGKEISPANFSQVTSENGITTVNSSITLAGGATLAQGVWWCKEDLLIPVGVKVTITHNVQLRVRGYLQINGAIDGKGRGLPGAAGVTAVKSADPKTPWSVLISEWNSGNIGTPGYIKANSRPQMGIAIARSFGSTVWGAVHDENASVPVVGGRVTGAEQLNLNVAEHGLDGLPPDLRGGSGSGGGALTMWWDKSYVTGSTDIVFDFEFRKVADGGAGGNGGAGLAIVSRGFDLGENAYIDVSGTDGARGGDWSPSDDGLPLGSSSSARGYAGVGAGGGPGAVYFVMDGSEASPDNSINGNNLRAYFGATNWGGERSYTGTLTSGIYGLRSAKSYGFGSGSNPAISSIYGPEPAPENIWRSVYKVQILAGHIDAKPDQPIDTDNPLSIRLTELTNTPRSASANLSTIEVGIDPPAVSNYSYALIEYREKGQLGWFEVGPASPEVGFVVPSDGKTYEVQARGVSLSGRTNPNGVIGEITTTKIRVPDDPRDPDENGTPETPPELVVRVPNVNGLELFQQGNDTVFAGREAKFAWRKTSVTEWFEIGQEGQQGAGAGALDLYFKDYQVEIWADGRLVRTEWVVDPIYTYTHEKNAEDYKRLHGQSGAWRAFECRVYCRGRQNQISEQPARLAVENPPSGLPDSITITPSLRSVAVEFKAPEDLDYRHTRVWLSADDGFTPSDDNLAAQVDGSVAIQGLAPNKNYYIRLASYDAFGQGPMSPQFSVTTPQIENDDIADGSIDLETKVGGRLQGDNIADGAVLYVTQEVQSPDTPIFDGADDGIWKEVADLDVVVLGDNSAISMNLFFSFDLDQVTEAWSQAGPGGPDAEFRLVRVNPNDPEDRLIVWNPDPVMISGSGRATIEFNATLDVGMSSGLVRYVAEARWRKGHYDAGTVDYSVVYGSSGKANLSMSNPDEYLRFNGCFPTTYMGEGWEVTLEGTGADPIPIRALPRVDGSSIISVATDGWMDWREYRTYEYPSAPLLDDASKSGRERLTNQPYYAENSMHKVVGSLTEYRLRATEYRG